MRTRLVAAASSLIVLALGAAESAWSQAWSQSSLAPGFTTLRKGATVAIMPTNIRLFLIPVSTVPEFKPDWTETAAKHFGAALLKKQQELGLNSVQVRRQDVRDLAEINLLHGAVAQAIVMHHFGKSMKLPTKDGKLDWSLGEPASAIKRATGADYALFTYIRDSYASAGQAALLIGAILLAPRASRSGLPGVPGQAGYASLVDLNTGQVVWFGRLLRGVTGDVREAEPASETVDALLDGFPTSRN